MIAIRPLVVGELKLTHGFVYLFCFYKRNRTNVCAEILANPLTPAILTKCSVRCRATPLLLRSPAATRPKASWEPAEEELPFIIVVVEHGDDVPDGHPSGAATRLHLSCWQNSKYKLRRPRVQVWTRWNPCKPLEEFPPDGSLPCAVQLQCDDDLGQKTSYELAEVLAGICHIGGGHVRVHRCVTEAFSGSSRQVVSIDRGCPVQLWSPAMQEVPKVTGTAAQRMERFAGRDIVLQQLFCAAQLGIGRGGPARDGRAPGVGWAGAGGAGDGEGADEEEAGDEGGPFVRDRGGGKLGEREGEDNT